MQVKSNLLLRDTLKAFVVPSAPEVQPVQELATPLVEHLDVVGLLAGKSPLIGMRLTQVKDGSVLALSLSHVLAGEVKFHTIDLEDCPILF